MTRRPIFRRTGRLLVVIAASVCLIAAASLAVEAATSINSAAKRRPSKAFFVKARFSKPVRPGVKSQVFIRIRNRRRHTIWITHLRYKISIDRAHRRRGCTVKRNFEALQIRRKTFPIKVTRNRRYRVRKKRKTRWLTPRMARMYGRPAVRMRNLKRVNQDACKGAKIKMTFRGRAVRHNPRKRKRGRRAKRASESFVVEGSSE